jgi:hypothetical protein
MYFTTDLSTSIHDNLESGKNTVDLIPNGSSVRVTEANKADFIRKKAHFLGYKCVSE